MDRKLEGHRKLGNYFSFKVEDLCLKDVVLNAGGMVLVKRLRLKIQERENGAGS